MDPVLTRHAPEPVRSLRRAAIPVVAAVFFVVLFALLLRLVEPSATVDRVTIENRSSFDVEVRVTDLSRAGDLPLAAVDPSSTTRVDDVLDQGSTWVFRVSQAGALIGKLGRSRSRLESDGWRVVVPATWDERIASTG